MRRASTSINIADTGKGHFATMSDTDSDDFKSVSYHSGSESPPPQSESDSGHTSGLTLTQEDAIKVVMRQIPEVTKTPAAAECAMRMLEEQLTLLRQRLRAVSDEEEEDEEDEEQGLGEDLRVQQTVEAHKKNETDKWRDLMVSFPLHSNHRPKSKTRTGRNR
jgi:hypothetical protein